MVDVVPLYGVRVRTPRLELRADEWRLPVPAEIAGLEPWLPLFGVTKP
ncbi:MAG TPA: hypothetical protein VJ986_02210 [Gaiellaceae bacterium]|nr:hypothetical protein [Gaiellaceae bacterium]